LDTKAFRTFRQQRDHALDHDHSDHDRRAFERYALEHWDTLTLIHGKAAYPCYVIDVSASGARIEVDARPPEGAEVYLQCPVGGAVPATVIWSSPVGIGVQFGDKWATAAFWYGRMMQKPDRVDA
jgi:hypothetical protein